MPNLIFPTDRTDYLGEIHFAPLIETSFAPIQLDTNSKISTVADNANLPRTDVMSFHGEDNKEQSLGNVSRPGRKCILFLPQSIMVMDGATYNNADLGTLGGLAEGVMNRRQSAPSNIGSFVDSMKGGGSRDAAKLMANTVAKAIAPEGVVNAVRSQTRITTNPNTRTLFESVPIREFTFNFKLIPRSEEESKIIKDIIMFFRTEIYPEEILSPEILGVQFSYGYRFPNRFNVEMMYNGIPVATKIKPCYLRNITTTYNGSTMGMFRDGNFLETDLTLTFLESNALKRSDVVSRGF